MPITINGSGTVTGISVGGLPDGIVDADMIANNAIVTGKITDGTITSGDIATGVIPSGGLSNAQIWRMTSNATGNLDPISNLEAADDATSGSLGTAMTESSGIFTFPTTGMWEVTAFLSSYGHWGLLYQYIYLKVSSDSGGSWDTVADGTQSWYVTSGSGTGKRSKAYCSAIVDVTDASTFRVKGVTSQANTDNTNEGSSTSNRTGFIFKLLGDT